jgi:hypothetical protein
MDIVCIHVYIHSHIFISIYIYVHIHLLNMRSVKNVEKYLLRNYFKELLLKWKASKQNQDPT